MAKPTEQYEKEIPCMPFMHKDVCITQLMLDDCCILGHKIIEDIVDERFGVGCGQRRQTVKI